MTANVLREARGHVAALIGNQPAGSKLKTAWPRLASLLGTTERRVRAIWNGEAKAIRADEMDALRKHAWRYRRRLLRQVDQGEQEEVQRERKAVQLDGPRLRQDG